MKTWLATQWLSGRGLLLPVRYWIGRRWEYLFGYEPDSAAWPHRAARWMRLSGYNN